MSNPKKNTLSADQALQRLEDGNKRYVQSKMDFPNQTAARRAELASGQQPFAIILGCSDSRVPSTVVFDQGLGDLFEIRVAGNVPGEMGIASMEYAAAHLDVALLMVLGHSNCGAVAAVASGGKMEGHLPAISAAISPAIDSVRDLPGNFLKNAEKENAKMAAEKLRNSEPVLSSLVKSGKLKVVAAYLQLDSGLVELLD